MRMWIVAAAVLAVATIGTARAEEPIVIKFSHVLASDTPKGKGADKFDEFVKEANAGTH